MVGIDNVPLILAAAAFVPRPGPLTIDKIAKPLALFLDPVRCEIDKLRFGPVASVERTVSRWRNELDRCIANCCLDCGGVVEHEEEGYKTDDAQERMLHVFPQSDLRLAITGRALRDSFLYEAKMS